MCVMYVWAYLCHGTYVEVEDNFCASVLAFRLYTQVPGSNLGASLSHLGSFKFGETSSHSVVQAFLNL